MTVSSTFRVFPNEFFWRIFLLIVLFKATSVESETEVSDIKMSSKANKLRHGNIGKSSKSLSAQCYNMKVKYHVQV